AVADKKELRSRFACRDTLRRRDELVMAFEWNETRDLAHHRRTRIQARLRLRLLDAECLSDIGERSYLHSAVDRHVLLGPADPRFASSAGGRFVDADERVGQGRCQALEDDVEA